MAWFCSWCCGDGNQFDPVPLEEMPSVELDAAGMGQDVVIVKGGRRICGTGAALANTPIVQDKAYFEVKVQASGVWGVGLAAPQVNLNRVPLGEDERSWALRDDSAVWHNGRAIVRLPEVVQEGDVIGLSYDHVELNFFLNGKPMGSPLTGIKGTVYPLVYVDEGAILDVLFRCFYHESPPGFSEIMMEKQLL